MDAPFPKLEAYYTAKRRQFEEAWALAGMGPSDFNQLPDTVERVFTLSDFASSCCIRNPGLLTELVDSGDLNRTYPADFYRVQLADAVETAASRESLEKILRNLRSREMLRIAWRDLSGWADLHETMADLSAFAEACIQESLARLHRWQCEEYGMPRDSNGQHQQLVIIGMGKLGGYELNFSSDVDLIFAYPRAGETVGGPKSCTNDEFFLRLARNLLQLLNKPTSAGTVFRTDMRLRPYGDEGPLVMSFDAMERYYQEQGREWERYAWIKARVVGGDRNAGRKLLDRLNPFVYRRYLDYGAFESLRDMKRKISHEIRRKGFRRDIKIGRGGIREIEFFGQVFQLIRGGILPRLQENRILKVLDILVDENHIGPHVRDELRDAYIFLRTTEHRLQEFSDQQTHRIPEDALGIQRLALGMNFDNPDEFFLELERHRENVHRHFLLLLEPTRSGSTGREQIDELEALWQGAFEEPRSEAILLRIGYDSPKDARAILEQLRDYRSLRSLGKEGRRRLDKLVPLLIRAAADCDDPVATLARITDLILAIEGRAAYLALLLENPDSLTQLAKLTCASSLIATFLAHHPVLLDELLDPRTLYAPPGREELEKEMRMRLGRCADDLEYQMEALRIFKQVNVLRVAAADVTEVLPLMRVSDRLTDIAEVALNETIELTWHHLAAKHGNPVCRINGRTVEKGFAVIAYGKLGGYELGYGSDLDLVFLHSAADGETDGRNPLDNRQFFARLGQRVIHFLTAHTRAGILYETDMRLRPSGSSGVLVSHIEGFRDYQLNDAWTWEHQAFIRARAVAGAPDMIRRFEQIRREVVGRRREPRKLRKEVADMRRRMRQELLKPSADNFDIKQGRGGIVDIEFLVQYLVLLHAHRHGELLTWTDNVRLIQTLMETGVLDETRAHVLKHAYLIQRAMAHKLGLQEKPARIPKEKFRLLRKRVAEIWDTFFKP